VTDTPASWGGWAPAVRDDPARHFAQARARCPVQRVRLADGHLAWVVLGYDAARQALGDPRISKDMLAALAADGEVVAEGLPGPSVSRHMLNVDPPDHPRLRRLVSRAFVPGRIAALEPAEPVPGKAARGGEPPARRPAIAEVTLPGGAPRRRSGGQRLGRTSGGSTRPARCTPGDQAPGASGECRKMRKPRPMSA